MKTDEATKVRIKNLAYVGRALTEITNENNESTNIFVAKEALKKFEEGIGDLELDADTMEGMRYLINYLDKKLDKRMIQAQGKSMEVSI